MRLPASGHSFGEELLHFVQSVDVVTSEVEKEIRRLREEFLDGDYLRHYVFTDWRMENDGRRRLSLVSSHGIAHDVPLRSPGAADDLLAYSYEKGKCLWVTGIGGPHSQYVNEWNTAQEELPAYRSIDAATNTVVILPLKWQGSTFGLMVLESTQVGDTTPRFKFSRSGADELARIAQATAIVLVLQRAHETQRDSTTSAVERIRNRLAGRRMTDLLAKPTIFVASSSRADVSVEKAILETVAKTADVTLDHWKGNEAGNLHARLFERISVSTFGICYLSEPVGDGTYQDNPNVMFEAGMFNARDHEGWLLVREDKSPAIPFDIYAQNRIAVPRQKNGALSGMAFRQQLEARIQALLKRLS